MPRMFLGSHAFAVAAVLALMAAPVAAEGTFRNRDNKDANDPGEGSYPIPYQRPTVAEIGELLQRVRGYLEQAAPTRVVSRKTGQEITEFGAPDSDAVASEGEADAFYPLDYTMGVTHSGMLLAGEVTGDPRFPEFTRRHLQFIADRLPYFRAVSVLLGGARNETFGAILETDSLDDSGSMCAALIKARRAGVGPDLEAVIEHWTDYIARRQYRIADGTLARSGRSPSRSGRTTCT